MPLSCLGLSSGPPSPTQTPHTGLVSLETAPSPHLHKPGPGLPWFPQTLAILPLNPSGVLPFTPVYNPQTRPQGLPLSTHFKSDRASLGTKPWRALSDWLHPAILYSFTSRP